MMRLVVIFALGVLFGLGGIYLIGSPPTAAFRLASWPVTHDCAFLKSMPAGDSVVYPSPSHKSPLVTTWGQLAAFCQALNKTQESIDGYHWTSLPTCVKWGIQQKILAKEMDNLCVESSKVNNVTVKGGGLYLASDAESSREYGPCAIVVRIPAGTPVFNLELAMLFFDIKSRDDPRKIFLGRLVPFIDHNNPGLKWFMLHNHALTRDVVGGPKLDETDALRQPINWDFFDKPLQFYRLVYRDLDPYGFIPTIHIGDTADLRASIDWVRRFFGLLAFQDGFSLIRSISIAPDDPWSTFDPEHFPSYFATFEKYLTQSVRGEPIGVASPAKRWGARATTRQTWVPHISSSFLPALYKEISGHSSMTIRTDEVRGGGDEWNNTFVAIGAEVELMQANPYLWVSATPTNQSEDEYFTYYYYPDASHKARWEKLVKAGIISPEEERAIDQIEDSEKATQHLLRVLIEKAFDKCFDQHVVLTTTPKPCDAVHLMTDLVNIHPCGDFNGRTTRFTAFLASIEIGEPGVMAFLSDFDLLFPTASYQVHVREASWKYFKLKQALLERTLAVVTNQRRPVRTTDFYNLKEWNELVSTLEAFVGGTTHGRWKLDIPIDKDTASLIKTRQWIPLLDQIYGGTGWRPKAEGKVSAHRH